MDVDPTLGDIKVEEAGADAAAAAPTDATAAAKPAASDEPPAAAEDEQTYCICNRVSFGEMIGCDDEDCKTEWVRRRWLNARADMASSTSAASASMARRKVDGSARCAPSARRSSAPPSDRSVPLTLCIPVHRPAPRLRCESQQSCTSLPRCGSTELCADLPVSPPSTPAPRCRVARPTVRRFRALSPSHRVCAWPCAGRCVCSRLRDQRRAPTRPLRPLSTHRRRPPPSRQRPRRHGGVMSRCCSGRSVDSRRPRPSGRRCSPIAREDRRRPCHSCRTRIRRRPSFESRCAGSAAPVSCPGCLRSVRRAAGDCLDSSSLRPVPRAHRRLGHAARQRARSCLL